MEPRPSINMSSSKEAERALTPWVKPGFETDGFYVYYRGVNLGVQAGNMQGSLIRMPAENRVLFDPIVYIVKNITLPEVSLAGRYAGGIAYLHIGITTCLWCNGVSIGAYHEYSESDALEYRLADPDSLHCIVAAMSDFIRLGICF